MLANIAHNRKSAAAAVSAPCCSCSGKLSAHGSWSAFSLGAPSMASSAALMPSLAGSCAFLSPAGASVGAAGAAAPPSSSCSPASTSILSLLLSGFICSHHTRNE